MRFRLVVDGEPREIDIDRTPRGMKVRVDAVEYRAQVRSSKEGLVIRIGPWTHQVRFEGSSVRVDDAPHAISIGDLREEPPRRSGGGAGRVAAVVEVRPAMPGRVVRLAVAAGDRVKRGQTLVVLEAMKMQNEIPAPGDGIVREVGVAEGESVTADRVVAVLEVR